MAADRDIPTATLLVTCADRKGIVAALAQLLYGHGADILGATAHYATGEPDEGPIIDQAVVRASHRDSVEDLMRKGRDVERTVLAAVVRAHLEDRVLVYDNKTVVFE